jgi:hypothetical protein
MRLIRSSLCAGLIIVGGASLSACNKAADSDAPATVNLTSAGHPEDQFGQGFGKDFRADPMSKPANVEDGDVVPVSPTARPVPIS